MRVVPVLLFRSTVEQRAAGRGARGRCPRSLGDGALGGNDRHFSTPTPSSRKCVDEVGTVERKQRGTRREGEAGNKGLFRTTHVNSVA